MAIVSRTARVIATADIGKTEAVNCLAIVIMSGRMSTGLLVLSWVFVASRLFHALIFVTTNNIPRRFAVFTGGFLALVAMWLVFFADLATDL